MAETFGRGERVRLRDLPPWVVELPEESQAVFRSCIGSVFLIEEIDANGLLVLDVSAVAVSRFGGSLHDIRVEPTWVEPAE